MHHVEDGKTVQLVRTDVHESFKHTGGRAVIKSEGSAMATVTGFIAPHAQKAFEREGASIGEKLDAVYRDVVTSTGVGGLVDGAIGVWDQNREKWYRNFHNYLSPGSVEEPEAE